MKIKYFNYRDCKSFYIIIYKSGDIINSFEIKDCPNRFAIDKRNASEKGSNYTYRLVTDTVNNQFKCIDYAFLPQYCNSETMQTFMPLKEREKEIFKILELTIQKKDYTFSFTTEDINRFIG